MPKLIPYKCRFGHITIKKYSKNVEKPSEIVCPNCVQPSINEAHIFVSDNSFGTKHRSSYSYSIPANNYSREEKAVRI